MRKHGFRSVEEEENAEANEFAMCLLMPENLLRQSVKEMPQLDKGAIRKLADLYQVEYEIMLARLIVLGYTLSF